MSWSVAQKLPFNPNGEVWEFPALYRLYFCFSGCNQQSDYSQGCKENKLIHLIYLLSNSVCPACLYIDTADISGMTMATLMDLTIQYQHGSKSFHICSTKKERKKIWFADIPSTPAVTATAIWKTHSVDAMTHTRKWTDNRIKEIQIWLLNWQSCPALCLHGCPSHSLSRDTICFRSLLYIASNEARFLQISNISE